MIEKVKSVLAQEWMHVRRLRHGEVRQWVKESETDSWTSTARLVAMCLCGVDGKSTYPTAEAALAAVDAFDWQLVKDIDEQAGEFNGLYTKVKDAEKNS